MNSLIDNKTNELDIIFTATLTIEMDHKDSKQIHIRSVNTVGQLPRDEKINRSQSINGCALPMQ